MDERFLRAFTDPAETKILGRLVYPFSLKYRVRLWAINSPFVTGSNVRVIDLLAAIKTCAEQPLGKLTKLEILEVSMISDDAGLFKRLCAEFSVYMLEDNSPKFWQKDGKAGSTGIPWILNIIATLISNGIAERRAWEMPECQAIWLATSFSSLKGADLKVLTTADEEMLKNFNKILNRN